MNLNVNNQKLFWELPIEIKKLPLFTSMELPLKGCHMGQILFRFRDYLASLVNNVNCL